MCLETKSDEGSKERNQEVASSLYLAHLNEDHGISKTESNVVILIDTEPAFNE